MRNVTMSYCKDENRRLVLPLLVVVRTIQFNSNKIKKEKQRDFNRDLIEMEKSIRIDFHQQKKQFHAIVCNHLRMNTCGIERTFKRAQMKPWQQWL